MTKEKFEGENKRLIRILTDFKPAVEMGGDGRSATFPLTPALSPIWFVDLYLTTT